MTCTATHSITQADLDAGHYANTACVNAASASEKCDEEDVPGVKKPALSLKKSASPASYDEVGDLISYSYLVKNTGNVRLAGPVTVADDKATVSCPAVNTVGNLDAFLDPGEQITCTASYAINQADLNGGSVTNTAKASVDGTHSNEDDETVTAVKKPALSIVKSATEQSFDAVGDVIHYSIVATNAGNVTLAAVTVTDAKVAGLSCTPANGSSLAPGASMTCTATHSITQADLDAGHYANTACVNAASASEKCDEEDVPGVKTPALSLKKSASPASYDEVGDVISYSYLVKNTGNVRLAGPVTVADDKATVSCPAVNTVGNLDAFLDPGEQVTCTASYAVTQADLNNGSVTNTAKASAGGVQSPEDKETVTAKAPPSPTPPPPPPAVVVPAAPV